MFKQKTKSERQAWWRALSPEEQEDYIKRRQAKKAAHRERSGYTPEVTGFEATGVNPGNRAEWQALILKRNQWLDAEVFIS